MSWVQCWGMAHAPLSLLRFPEKERTLRIIVNTPVSGCSLRVRLSNKYGRGNVTVGALTAARCDICGIIPDNEPVYGLTYGGKSEFKVEKNSYAVSDAVNISVAAGEYLCVSAYIKKGALESGNSLNNATLLFCDGNASQKRRFMHAGRPRDGVIFKTVSLLGLHHPLPIPLFEDIELDNRTGASSIVCFGDSITQQGYWTNEFEQLIRARFPGRYSVINKAVTGNRLLSDSEIPIAPGLFGENAFARVENDVFSHENVTHAVISIGVNDMIQPGSFVALKSRLAEPQRFYDALRDFYGLFREHGIKTVGMNFPPFGGSPDATPEKHLLRRTVNDWFRENKNICDEFVDIYTLTRRGENPDLAPREILGEDNLHPNALGGKILAHAIPLDFFN